MFNRIFRKSNEYPRQPKPVPAWVNKDDAEVRYVAELGIGTLAKGTALMAGMKSPHGSYRLCEILNPKRAIRMFAWVKIEDLQSTPPA